MRMTTLTKRRLIRLFIVCAVCFASTIAYFCFRESAEERFAARLHATIVQASKNETSTFSMSSVTDFTWDAFYVFGPYTGVETVEQTLGFSWPAAQDTGIEWNEALCLLVFTYKKNVVFSCMYCRAHGDFESVEGVGRIPAGEDRFRVKKRTDGWIVVETVVPTENPIRGGKATDSSGGDVKAGD